MWIALPSHRDGVLARTNRLSNRAVEARTMAISRRSFDLRRSSTFIAGIYHCYARLPPPARTLITLLDGNQE